MTEYKLKGIIILHSNLNIISDGIGSPAVYADEQWIDSDFAANPSLDANTEYVLAYAYAAMTDQMPYDTGATDQGHVDTSNSYASPTSPTDATHNDRKYSIYAEYTAGTPPEPGWLAGYAYRKSIPLTGGLDGELTDYQLKLDIAYDSDMLADFSDLRFTKEDGETLIDAWLGDKTDGESADVWVEFPHTPADGVEETKGYLYFGKADAVSRWDIGETFLFGDDFPGTSLDTTKWEVVSGTDNSVSGNTLTLDGNGADRGIYTKSYNHPSSGAIIDYKGKSGNAVGWGRAVGSCVDTGALYKGAGGLGHYGDGRKLKVWDYSANSQIVAQDWADDTWYDISTILKPDEIRIEALGNHVAVSNTLASHPVGIYAYKDRCLQNFRVRQYAANPPTYTFGSKESATGGAIAPTSIFYGPLVGPFGGPL